MTQHTFLKSRLVNFISKDANLVFYLSVYLLVHCINGNYGLIHFCIDSMPSGNRSRCINAVYIGVTDKMK